MIPLRAIEFFSGMGSFAEACRNTSLHVVAAFDQNQLANCVYEHNFDLRPFNLTLDSVHSRQIPDAEIWWMSPPCTPYSVRGQQDDIKDPRAKSLLRLLQLIDVKHPETVILENVRGFQQSAAKELVVATFKRNGYEMHETIMCSTDFGVPMRRPRYFLAGVRPTKAGIMPTVPTFSTFATPPTLPSIKDFLDANPCDENLIMKSAEFKKYEAGLNVISPNDPNAVCICFTKNYYRCRTASGSLLQMDDGQVRRFSSREILRLFGFSSQYNFPSYITEKQSSGLLGNAVDIRMIKQLLETIVAPSKRQPLSHEFTSCK